METTTPQPDPIYWCEDCGDYEVSAPGQVCAECEVDREDEGGGSDAGADWNGPDTMDEFLGLR